jgi:hypothetical protein
MTLCLHDLPLIVMAGEGRPFTSAPDGRGKNVDGRVKPYHDVWGTGV